jgi:colanic acid biosynthesis glycosyl transferase WcaI
VRVVFVNRYFAPDHSATSQMASDLASHLASRGWAVGAITSRQRYDDAAAHLPHRETIRRVEVTRVWSTRFGRAGLLGRAVDYLTFAISAFFAIRRERNAILVAMTDPPMLSVVAALGSRRVVNWIQDLFPEVAEALQVRMPLLRRIRDWSLRRARANVVLGQLMAGRVPKATVIHNWADENLRPLSRIEAGAGPELTVGYSGNLGRAHDVETIAAAIRLLPRVRFVFTGGGARLDELRREAPPNAEFRDYVPRAQLSASLSAADVHLVSLRPELEGLIVPSKFYGVLAVGRPVIFIGARDGELARIIDSAGCGLVVEPGDVDGLVRAVQTMAMQRAEAMAMGRRGRELYLHRFAPRHAFAAWEQLLEEVSR